MYVPPAFSIDLIRSADAAPAIAVRGELDFATAPALEAWVGRVTAKIPDQLVFDLSDMSFIDCAGLRIFARAVDQLPDGRVIVRRPTPLVCRMLAILQIDECAVEDEPTMRPSDRQTSAHFDDDETPTPANAVSVTQSVQNSLPPGIKHG